MPTQELHIVYLRPGGLLVVRAAGASWRELQDQYPDYMASLGPWEAEAVWAFLCEEYPDRAAGWRRAYDDFVATGAAMLDLDAFG